jgi:hypothetical protein
VSRYLPISTTHPLTKRDTRIHMQSNAHRRILRRTYIMAGAGCTASVPRTPLSQARASKTSRIFSADSPNHPCRREQVERTNLVLPVETQRASLVKPGTSLLKPYSLAGSLDDYPSIVPLSSSSTLPFSSLPPLFPQPLIGELPTLDREASLSSKSSKNSSSSTVKVRKRVQEPPTIPFTPVLT